MLFQVYFKRSLDSSEWSCLPEYCRTLPSILDDYDQTPIINGGFGENIFGHTGSRSVPEAEGFRMPFTLPANSVLQVEQTDQWPGHPFESLGGYTIAGIIIQGKNLLLPRGYQEDCQQIPTPPEFVSAVPETRHAGDATPDAFHSLPTPLSEKRFQCPEKGCLNRRGEVPSFGRYSDLLRHTISFHKHSQEFTCIVSGCNTSTKRLDKLKAHLSKMHGDLGFRRRE